MAVTTSGRLAISSADELVYGTAPEPVDLRSGMRIGGGTVYPELNFTLSTMQLTEHSLPQMRSQYREMITGACQRALELEVDGMVIEFEMLPDMTLHPSWGTSVVELLREELDRFAQKGLATGLRVTPNDIREFDRPPLLRTGVRWEDMLRSFEASADAGADMLAIESTGGKEVHDGALLNADLPAIVFSLGVLGPRDMSHLWDHIVEIADRRGTIASGDSACGFANTAMVLADQRNIPRVLAALVRVLSVPRSLVAFERGAVGAGKDCAYEGPFTKAITGRPISLEGSEAACAHLSPIGNIAKATADLLSNESVQNVRLLGAMAPTVSLEQLVYATRLMNTAASHDARGAVTMRDWLVASDAFRDPQAYVLRPDVVVALSQAIVEEPTPYLRTRRAGLETLAVLRDGVATTALHLPRAELRWLDRLSAAMEEIPESEDELIGQVSPQLTPEHVRLDQYGLSA